MVLLFSDTAGWDETFDRVAQALVVRGATVAGVDLPSYLARLAASDDGCHYLISEIEDTSKRIERDLKFEGYRSPILAGIGQGGTLVYAALAQAPAATIEGAVSIDPTAELFTRVPLCAGAPSVAEANGFRYEAHSLPGWWKVSAAGQLARSWKQVAAACGGAAAALDLDGSAEERLIELIETARAPASAAEPLRKLPIVEYPAVPRGGRVLLVFLSGDGGWRDLDKEISEIIARRGYPVVGVDSLRYFWRRKSPAQVADDLAAILQTYGTRWQASRFALAGYSFGADVLPFAYNRLPPELRDAVVQVSLLGVESTALFEFKLEGWFTNVAGEPVLPELRRIPVDRVQCFYGEGEEDTLCRSPELSSAEIIRTTGSHHFDRNYQALAERILAGIERRLPARSSPADDAAQAAGNQGGNVRQHDGQGEPAR